MRVVIFGIGEYYNLRKKTLYSELTTEIEVVALLDNNSKIGSLVDGILVFHPEKIVDIVYDKIVIMSSFFEEMKRQLLALGVLDDQIELGDVFIAKNNHGKISEYGLLEKNKNQKSVIVLTTNLYYNGGTLAAVYAVKALIKKGYSVSLCAQKGDKDFINEIVKDGIHIILIASSPYFDETELEIIKKYDYAIVNVFQMVYAAYLLEKEMRTIWWVHESPTMYEYIRNTNIKDYKLAEHVNAKIYAVSDVAKKNFQFFFPNKELEVLPYGIPDDSFRGKEQSKSKDKLVFMVAGGAIYIKGYDLFLDAIDMINEETRKQCEFWILGNVNNDKFGREIQIRANKIKEVKLLGQHNRDNMKNIYQLADVVVVPSRMDCLPMVAAEGMMYEKLCILSEVVGTTKYVTNYKDALICKYDDVLDLYRQMIWVIKHSNQISRIGKNGRKIYERYFSMDTFSDHLSDLLK